MRETVTAALVEELAAGELDLIIASIPLGNPNFAEVPVFQDAFLMATPTIGPYALLDISDPGAIPPEALLLLEDGHCLRDQTLAVCGSLNGKRLKSSGVTSLATILQLVSAGQGLTLLPEIFLAAGDIDPKRIRLTRFHQPEPSRMIGVAWRRTNPRAAQFDALVPHLLSCRQEIAA